MSAGSRGGRVRAAAAGDLPAYKCGYFGHKSKRTGRPCRQNVVTGTEHCPHHAGKPLEQLKAEGAIRIEASKWTLAGHDGSDVDPRQLILTLIAFWRWKVDLYGAELQRQYEAAEALGARVQGEAIVTLNEPEWEVSDGEDGVLLEHPALQRARLALETTFKVGGVAAFVGHQYDVDRNGRVFAVTEGVRALVTLEENAHKMLAKYIQLAISAKVAESRIQLAQQAGVMIQAVILGVLRDLSVATDERVMRIIAANLDAVAGQPTIAA